MFMQILEITIVLIKLANSFDILYIILRSMIQAIRSLCDISNFIDLDEEYTSQISFSDIEQFSQINNLIAELIQKQFLEPAYSKQLFIQLSQLISIEEESFGPKKFKKMIESISTIIINYVIRKLKKSQIDKAILCLTYYERSCSKYFTSQIKIILSMIYALAHFRKQSHNIAEQYITNVKEILKTEQSINKNCPQTSNLKIILSTFEGMLYLKQRLFSKSKCIFSDIISFVTDKIHDDQKRYRQLTTETKYLFVMSTYYMSQVYMEMGQHDKSAYNITQCLQFAQQNYLEFAAFVNHHSSAYQHITHKQVKLSRIQNKIERVKTLYSINTSVNSKQVNPFLRKNSFKITLKNKQKEKVIERELNNLLILDQNNEMRLKKKTLNGIKSQINDRQKQIHAFANTIQSFKNQRVKVQSIFQNEQCKEQIQQQIIKQKNIRKQIQNGIWDVIHTLKPLKKLEMYFSGLKIAIDYEKTNKFYKFLCNQVSMNSYLKLYSLARKVRSKLTRLRIQTCYIDNIRHQAEFLQHKIDKTYHLNLYQVESGAGYNAKLQISEETIEYLKHYSLSFCFEMRNGIFMTLKQYLQSFLQQSVFIQIKLFIIKMRKRLQKKNNLLTFDKKRVAIGFSVYESQLVYSVFIINKKIGEGQYQHLIERIDTIKYFNKDYDIKIQAKIVNNQPKLQDNDLSTLIIKEITENKMKYMCLISRIQIAFKRKLSKIELKKRKVNMTVTSKIINRNIFTLITHYNIKNFYIEHLGNKYPIVIMRQVSFGNISFLDQLIPALIENDNCDEQLNVIKKHFKARNFVKKFIKKSKEVKLIARHETKFRKSLCFCKLMKKYLYRGKYIDGKMMYTLTVKDFEEMPRPYMLRVFTIESKSLYSVDFDQIINKNQKIFLENNLDRINEIIDIQQHRKANILFEGPAKYVSKIRKNNSRSSIFSNFSFVNDQFRKEQINSRGSRVLSREVSILKNKQNSINYKMRHKPALKQKDIVLIKKWMEEIKKDSSIEEYEQSSQN